MGTDVVLLEVYLEAECLYLLAEWHSLNQIRWQAEALCGLANEGQEREDSALEGHLPRRWVSTIQPLEEDQHWGGLAKQHPGTLGAGDGRETCKQLCIVKIQGICGKRPRRQALSAWGSLWQHDCSSPERPV